MNLTRCTIGAAAMIWVLLCAMSHADDPDAIVGLWTTAGGESRVEIAGEDGEFTGAIVWLKEPTYPEGDEEAGEEKRDRLNPDPGKQDEPILGLKMLEGFKHDGGNKWGGGTIYDPKSGKTYSCIIKLEGEQLHVRGYVGLSIMGRTTVWTRYVPGEDETDETEAAPTAAEESGADE